ncbi:hypothetical protein ACJRPK_04820 [Aquimarina sp. 2-A2]|uniref:hypothetical protein n=1 Tax=Aquimarina sp. 2-A2 TaxID=3382644 RepID=UPI00387EF993
MKNFTYLILVFLVLVGVTGCSSDDEIGSGNAILKISAELKDQKSGKTPEKLVFTSGYVWVSEIVFDGTLQRGTSISRTVERFSQIDFATGIANPSLDDIIIPAGDYTFVNLEVKLRDEDSQPGIVMEGIYIRTDGSEVSIRFEFNSGEVFEAETSQQVSVEENTSLLSKILFDPNIWFSVVSNSALDNAFVNSDGIMIISERSNEAIFDLVADRLDASTEAVFK